MKASELSAILRDIVSSHGDKDVVFDDGLELRPVLDVDLGAEEDDKIVLWPSEVD